MKGNDTEINTVIVLLGILKHSEELLHFSYNDA